MSDFRLEKARSVGIDAVCNVTWQSSADAVHDAFGDAGLRVAFECAGVEDSLDDAAQNIQKGGLIVVVGVYSGRPSVDMAIVNDRELRLVPTLMYQQSDYRQAVKWLSAGAVKVEPLISRHFAFSEYSDAYRFIDQNAQAILKVIIDLESEPVDRALRGAQRAATQSLYNRDRAHTEKLVLDPVCAARSCGRRAREPASCSR